MNTEPLIDRSRSQQLLRAWREQLSITADTAADALGIELEVYQAYEEGKLDLPISLWRRCQNMKTTGDMNAPESVSLPRDRWVRMVENSMSYLRNEHHMSRLILEEKWEEVADFMNYMRSGPNHDLALTDPHLYRHLREAGTRAALSGLMHFRGPTRPFPENSIRNKRTEGPVRQVPTTLGPKR
jgi:hypothetical protein